MFCFLLNVTMLFLAYIACWIVHSVKAVLSLFIHIHTETDYMEQLGE